MIMHSYNHAYTNRATLAGLVKRVLAPAQVGHDLAVGAFSRVRFAKLITRGLEQSLWRASSLSVPTLRIRLQAELSRF